MTTTECTGPSCPDTAMTRAHTDMGTARPLAFDGEHDVPTSPDDRTRTPLTTRAGAGAHTRSAGAIARAVADIRRSSWNDGDESRVARRPVASAFESALWTLEEMAVGQSSPEDPPELAALVGSVRTVVGVAAPAGVLSARTPAALHGALLDWQDQLELRRGRPFDGGRVRLRRIGPPFDPLRDIVGVRRHELVDERLGRIVGGSQHRAA